MTNHLHRSSLLQARESFSDNLLPSVTLNSHARSTAHLQAHRHTHYPHTHDHSGPDDKDDNESGDDRQDRSSRFPSAASAASPATDSIIAKSDLDDRASSDSSSLDARSPVAAVDDARAARADDAASYVTQVVQTVSLIQVVDYSGSPISTSTQYANPNTVVVDPDTGETVSQTAPAFTIAVNPSSLLPGLGLDSGSSSTPSTTTSTHHTTSTSLKPSPAPVAPSASGFPTLSDISNGTAWGNATAVGAPSNSTFKALGFTQSSNISTTLSNFRLFSTASDDTSTSSSSSWSSSTYISTPTWNTPTAIPTVEGSAETSSSSSSSDGDPLTPQQKQIVGGVVGSIAGVAFLALLVMLALRYKKRRDGQSLPGNSETRGFAALPASGSDATNSMAERNGAASSVGAAFAALTNQRQPSGAAGSSNQLQVPGGEERGFYRVSGRKLPSVLYNGGDGYTNPRESTLSQFSQSSEPFNRGDQPFALGTPMRPVSGVPIMRSGPARTPVTEANPFADPVPSPPRRPGSSGSPRASGSRFQESI